MTAPEALAIAYAPSRRGRPFGFYDPLYAWPHTHRGADYREQNASRTASVITHVVAIEAGEVVYAQRAPDFPPGVKGGKIGGVIAIKTRRPLGTGVYEIHSHTIPAVKVGDKVVPGQKIGRNAGWIDASIWRGTSWRGCHDHIVFSDSYDGAWSTIRRVFDPEPIIQAALRANPIPSTGGKPSPAPKPTPAPEQEESNDMSARIIGVPKDMTTREPFHRYLVIPGVGSVHISNSDDLELLRRYIASGTKPSDEVTFRDGELARVASYMRGEKPVDPPAKK